MATATTKEYASFEAAAQAGAKGEFVAQRRFTEFQRSSETFNTTWRARVETAEQVAKVALEALHKAPQIRIDPLTERTTPIWYWINTHDDDRKAFETAVYIALDVKTTTTPIAFDCVLIFDGANNLTGQELRLEVRGTKGGSRDDRRAKLYADAESILRTTDFAVARRSRQLRRGQRGWEVPLSPPETRVVAAGLRYAEFILALERGLGVTEWGVLHAVK